MATLNLQIANRSYPVTPTDLEKLDVVKISENEYHLIQNGNTYHCTLNSINLPAKRVSLTINGQALSFDVKDEVDALIHELGLEVASAEVSKNVVAPMPGLVLDILVQPGDEVKAGDKLLILEAMKMENSLSANSDGTVQAISIAKGDAVEKLQLLIEIA